MLPVDRSATNAWAVQHVLALVEIWALVAQHSGLVGAWRLTGVCRAALEGAKEWLGTLPVWVVYGGIDGYVHRLSEGWRLDLATLRWEHMPALVPGRCFHSCCTVRGALVVLGGKYRNYETTSRVEILSGSGVNGGFTSLPPLSCGGVFAAVALAVEESDSAKGQVLLLGGLDEDGARLSTVHLVDLATGVCTPQPTLLDARYFFTADRIPDGRVVCAGGSDSPSTSAEVWGPPASGAANTAWVWAQLPAMSVGRYGCCGCVMSDGRLAVLGGMTDSGLSSSCEALMVTKGGHWVSLPPMHRARHSFTCAAVGRCIIVVGGFDRSAEVYDEILNRWTRLPCDLPGVSTPRRLGSALL
jgi:hypothetical protein